MKTVLADILDIMREALLGVLVGVGLLYYISHGGGR
jgi:hypothetical protein